MAKRVYFAFHYQDVIDFRANVVRKHNFTKDIEKAGYFDHSMWEAAKTVGAVALKRLINAELKGSTVTAVLIGTHTYARRWVRYEIFKSVEKGNLVLGIHINAIKDRNQLSKVRGPNPLDYLGLMISQDGLRGTPTEWDGRKWVYYSDLGSFPISQQPLIKRGKNWQISKWFNTYDWLADDGYNNFVDWID
jgi:hypothetical protein